MQAKPFYLHLLSFSADRKYWEAGAHWPPGASGGCLLGGELFWVGELLKNRLSCTGKGGGSTESGAGRLFTRDKGNCSSAPACVTSMVARAQNVHMVMADT